MAKQNEPLIVGRWRITEMEMLDQDVFDEEVKAFIRFDPDGMGEFHFCYVHGFIDYRLAERDGEPAAEWSWDGNDEHHLAQGRGWAVRQDDGMLEGMIFFHRGDESSFRAKKWPNGKAEQKQPRMTAILPNGKVRRIRR